MAAVAVAFDTLKAATRLQEEAGFKENQARVLVATFAEGIVENLATKQDLVPLATKADLAALREDYAKLRGDLEKIELSLRGEITKLRGALRGEIGELRGDLRGEISELRGEITKLRGDLEKTATVLRGEITELRGDLGKTELSVRGEITTLRGELSKVQERLTVRMGAAVGTGVAILGVLYKLL